MALLKTVTEREEDRVKAARAKMSRMLTQAMLIFLTVDRKASRLASTIMINVSRDAAIMSYWIYCDFQFQFINIVHVKIRPSRQKEMFLKWCCLWADVIVRWMVDGVTPGQNTCQAADCLRPTNNKTGSTKAADKRGYGLLKSTHIQQYKSRWKSCYGLLKTLMFDCTKAAGETPTGR